MIHTLKLPKFYRNDFKHDLHILLHLVLVSNVHVKFIWTHSAPPPLGLRNIWMVSLNLPTIICLLTWLQEACAGIYFRDQRLRETFFQMVGSNFYLFLDILRDFPYVLYICLLKNEIYSIMLESQIFSTMLQLAWNWNNTI